MKLSHISPLVISQSLLLLGHSQLVRGRAVPVAPVIRPELVHSIEARDQADSTRHDTRSLVERLTNAAGSTVPMAIPGFAAPPDAAQHIIAFGDSYSAGIGADLGNNDHDEDQLCRHGEAAFPNLLANDAWNLIYLRKAVADAPAADVLKWADSINPAEAVVATMSGYEAAEKTRNLKRQSEDNEVDAALAHAAQVLHGPPKKESTSIETRDNRELLLDKTARLIPGAIKFDPYAVPLDPWVDPETIKPIATTNRPSVESGHKIKEGGHELANDSLINVHQSTPYPEGQSRTVRPADGEPIAARTPVQGEPEPADSAEGAVHVCPCLNLVDNTDIEKCVHCLVSPNHQPNTSTKPVKGPIVKVDQPTVPKTCLEPWEITDDIIVPRAGIRPIPPPLPPCSVDTTSQQGQINAWKASQRAARSLKATTERKDGAPDADLVRSLMSGKDTMRHNPNVLTWLSCSGATTEDLLAFPSTSATDMELRAYPLTPAGILERFKGAVRRRTDRNGGWFYRGGPKYNGPFLTWGTPVSLWHSLTDVWTSVTGGTPVPTSSAGVQRQVNAWHPSGGTSMALVSVGGNDIGFSQIIKKCVIRLTGSSDMSDCEGLIELMRNTIVQPTLRRRYFDIFDAIFQKAKDTGLYNDGTHAVSKWGYEENTPFRITVTGYARFFNDETPQCDSFSFSPWPLSSARMTTTLRYQLNELVIMLNNELRAAVQEYNLQKFGAPISNTLPNGNSSLLASSTSDRVLFVDIDAKFEGHRFCEPGIEEPDRTNANNWFFHIFGWDHELDESSLTNTGHIEANAMQQVQFPECLDDALTTAKALNAGQSANLGKIDDTMLATCLLRFVVDDKPELAPPHWHWSSNSTADGDRSHAVSGSNSATTVPKEQLLQVEDKLNELSLLMSTAVANQVVPPQAPATKRILAKLRNRLETDVTVAPNLKVHGSETEERRKPGMGWLPTIVGKVFHPKSAGHRAIRDALYEHWAQAGWAPTLSQVLVQDIRTRAKMIKGELE